MSPSLSVDSICCQLTGVDSTADKGLFKKKKKKRAFESIQCLFVYCSVLLAKRSLKYYNVPSLSCAISIADKSFEAYFVAQVDLSISILVINIFQCKLCMMLRLRK